MKKARKLFLVCLMAVLALATFMFAACGEKNISVITRESGSGTRSAFEELVSKDGVELKKAELVSGISEQSSTSAVISQVASIPTAIGFVSLGSVDSSVKVLTLGGVAANSANVISGDYKLARPFVVAWNDAFGENGESLTALTKDFVSYLKSADAQEIIVEEGYVTVDANDSFAAFQTSLTGTVSASDKVVIRGSTSMDELMDKLEADYISIVGSAHGVVAGNFDKQCEGSSAGMTAAKGDNKGNTIGMSSSELSDADAAELEQFTVARDAIAVIVNKDNDQISNITIEQLFDIYTGAITKFSQLDAE